MFRTTRRSQLMLKTFNVMVLTLLVLMPLLSACAGPTPTPAIVGTPIPGTAPVTTPSRVPPATIEPTPTRAPLPPTVVAMTPNRGEEQPIDAPVLVTFDQPMDPNSTKAAFSIDPQVPGSLEVQANTLLWKPGKPLARATRYDVRLAGAKSAQGLPMLAPAEFRFVTVGYLEVTSVQPSAGAQDIDPASLITVVFNRPVVPLTGVDAQAGLPQPLVFEPAVKGAGRWVNTSVYSFKPDSLLGAGLTYSVTVTTPLSDTTGGELAEPFTWQFTTASPLVTGSQPGEGSVGVAPSATISVTFSQPMQPASTESAFSLRDATGAVHGTFNWAPNNSELGFRPAADLTYGATYTLTVQNSARAFSGEGALRETYRAQFQVVPLPKVIRVTPTDGEHNVNPVGAVNIYFTGTISEATLANAIGVAPVLTSTRVLTSFNFYDNRLYATWPWEPNTTYTVTLKGTVGDIYGNTLGDDYVWSFRTGDFRPFVSLNVAGPVGTYNAYTQTQASILHRNIRTVDLSLVRLDKAQFMRYTGENAYEQVQAPPNKNSRIERQWRITPPAEKNRSQVWFEPLVQTNGDALPPGLYHLTVRSPDVPPPSDPNVSPSPEAQVLAISRYNVTLKASTTDALVWVTDLKSGQPVANVGVSLEDERGFKQSGQTDASGVYTVTFPARDVYRPLFAFVGTPGEDDFGIASSRWTDGLDAWNFGLYGETYAPQYNVYLYTDRPIYRPGQIVYFKGIVRLDNDARYSLPTLKQAPVEIRDAMGNLIYRETLPLNALGTFHGEFKLDEEARLGFYNLNSQLTNDYGGSIGFQVAEYRKPEFEMTVTPAQPAYRQGDTITVTVQANYFFGGAVKNAQVRWSVLSQNSYFDYQGEGYYSFQDITDWTGPQETVFGKRIGEGAGQTDANGRLIITVPADIAAEQQSQVFTFDVGLTDINNQEVYGSTRVIVHKGDLYVGVAPAEYVGVVGQPMAFDVITVDPDSIPLPQKALTVTLSQAEWKSVQERDDSGHYFWTSQVKETVVYTTSVTTGREGRAQVKWTPQDGGQYLVRATGVDSAGNTIRAAAFFWVSASTDQYVSWRRQNNDRIELVVDKQSYQPGDTARLLIPSPFQGEVTALLTSERGRTYDYRVITLTGNSTSLEVPIKPIYAPNVFFSVVLMQGMGETSTLPSFKLGYTPLVPVSTEQVQVFLTVTPSKPVLEPRDTVSFTVQARDFMSRPLATEVSLALVDKAVLSLADPNAPPILDAFYRQRGLGILTALTLVINVDRINEQQAAGTKGGGGGDGMMGPMFVRSEFPDNAYWRADLMTGADGTATVSVRLPDNVTTWRMLAKAVNADTQVGETTSDIQVTRPLLVRPVLPRFLTVGDRAEVAAVVNNNTNTAQKVNVSMAVTGLAVSDPLQQTIDVEPNGAAKVTWNVTAQAVDEVQVNMVARSETLNDAVQLTLPVYRYTTPEIVGSSGQVELGIPRLESVVIPPSAVPDQGELQVTLEPSLAAGMRGGLTYLEHYPYECTEQTLSRFLPNVVTARAFHQLGIDRPALAAQLAEQVNVGLQRLYTHQNVDGGWGWWPGEESNPFISAYVVYGLQLASDAGVSVDQAVLKRGLDYLERQLRAPRSLSDDELNRQAFILYVLAEAGRGSVGRTVATYDARERLAHYAQAFLALALAELETSPTASVTAGSTVTATSSVTPSTTLTATAEVTGSLRSRADTLLDNLRGSVIESAAGAHWEEGTIDFWNMTSDTRSTAIVLSAFARLRPNEAVAPSTVRWLMSVREEGHWRSTQETAWSVLSLTDWMVASGELQGDYSYRVTLNGQSLGEGAVNPETVEQTVTLQQDIQNMLRDTANALVFERAAVGNQTGDGRLYYSTYLRYFLPADEILAQNRGLSIQREYRLARCGQAADVPCPVTNQATVGDVIDVRLTLVVPNNLTYVVVEDPLPAGAEAIDTSLKTTSILAQGPDLSGEPAATPEPGWIFWLPSHSELRDEKVALFASWMPAGTYTYRYQIRASLPGEYLALPANGYQMYFPDVWGRSAGAVFTIRDAAQ